MKLTLRPDLGGYALDTLAKTSLDGQVIDRPIVLLTGPNGSGKSAVLRGIRASMGLSGERMGTLHTPYQRQVDIGDHADDPEFLATQLRGFGGETKPADYVPAVFSLADLRWKGQPTYLFDSRAASQIASAASFDDDIQYHVSLIAGGGRNVSHGQFVSKTWWEAIEWGIGLGRHNDPWENQRPSEARAAAHASVLGTAEERAERWLFIDEPETAIDAEALLLGLAVLIEAAEIGKLRVFCASHSLLFASGIADHPKLQTIDLGPSSSWLQTQRIAMKVANDPDKLKTVGKDILSRIKKKR